MLPSARSRDDAVAARLWETAEKAIREYVPARPGKTGRAARAARPARVSAIAPSP